jgi:hypothetical protein
MGQAVHSFPLAQPLAFATAPRTVDFRGILGEGAWAALPAAVQARFSLAAAASPHAYEGRMIVRANLAGLIIAQLCRLIGTPLAPFRGEDVPVTVKVHTDPDGGLVWGRVYAFGARPPILVSSRKIADEQGGLMEVVRCGLGMRLALCVRGGALHFRSLGYFAGLFGLRIPIPALLTPGRALITHEDLGAGWFRFTLTFRHPLLGETFHQTGVFREG